MKDIAFVKCFFLILPLTFFCQTAQAADSYCNPNIKPASFDELAYKDRGDRCEGLFVQKVSATGLRVVAFHKNPARFDDNARALNVSVNVHVDRKEMMVTSLRPNQYYRLDVTFSQDNYTMPLELLRHPGINIKPHELATVICIKDCQSAVPTLVAASFADENNANPYIALLANLEIFELSITIKDEVTGEILHEKEMLGSRTWPAGRPAAFPLAPYFKERDEILVEIIAVGRGNQLIDSIALRLRGS